MPSISATDSQTCARCGQIFWMLRTERLLSASCMGWCLQASFKEHPKSATIACAGGASSIYLGNFFRSGPVSRPAKIRIIRAGGLVFVAGVAMGLNMAYHQHPKAAIKACMAGALSFCLTKSVIFSDETPNKPKISSSPLKETEQVIQVGKELNQIANYFERRLSKMKDAKEDKNNEKSVKSDVIAVRHHFKIHSTHNGEELNDINKHFCRE